MVIADDDPEGFRRPVTPELVPPAPEPVATTTGLHAVVESVLDGAVRGAVEDPMPLYDAHDVRMHVQTPVAPGMTTFVVPALARLTRRWGNRVVNVGSRLSFSLKALLATVPPLATSVTLGTRELHSLASLVVQRLRAEDLPVDHRFVQRVTVNAYVWPGGGRPLAGRTGRPCHASPACGRPVPSPVSARASGPGGPPRRSRPPTCDAPRHLPRRPSRAQPLTSGGG